MKKRKVFNDMLNVIAQFDPEAAAEFRRKRDEVEFNTLLENMGTVAVRILDPLPNDVLEYIFSFLSLEEVKAFCATSRSFRRFCKERDLENKFLHQGAAYAFGRGTFGTLGDGRDDDHNVAIPQLIQTKAQGIVTQISCGVYHTAFVTRAGRAYAFGYGRNGQLGNGRDDHHTVAIPQIVQTDVQGSIAQISCGAYHTAFVTRDGQAYAFGYGHNGQLGNGRTDDHNVAIPQLIQTDVQGTITQISCGGYHTAFVTRDGQAYAFGRGLSGKLGDGRDDDHEVGIPQLIQTDVQGTITQISCGESHTAFVTRAGQAYAFGNGTTGQLGNGTYGIPSVSIPQLIQTEAQGSIAQISCGGYHTAFITRDGRAYAFGQGLSGQLGNVESNFRNEVIPQFIQSDAQGSIVQISCGGPHTAFVTRDGQAYAFGQGVYGQLGNGQTNFRNVPIPQLIQTDAQGTITQISCGVYHTAFVSSKLLFPRYVSCKICNRQAVSQCGACKKVSYCGQRCQAIDWSRKNHRISCSIFQKLK